MGFFSQFFVQPFMLLGGLLVSVPIIIYLWQRHRHHRRPWAAMEFLLRAVRRHQRRIQLQNLLLLIIRCLILFLLAFAMARPVLRSSSIAVGTASQQNWILAIDTSYSMSYKADAQSLFDRARESVLEMVRTLMQPGDKIAVVTMAGPPRTVMPATVVSEDLEADLRRELEDLSLSATSVDLGASFALLDEVSEQFTTVGGEKEPKQVVIFSDLQRKDWLRENEPRYPALGQFFDKMQEEGAEFSFAKLSANPHRANLAITDLSVSPPLIAKDLWVDIRTTVHNFGDQDFDNVDLTIQVDADVSIESEAQLGDVIRVPAGDSVSRSLRFKFEEAGDHTIAAEVRSDGLRLDNQRYLVARVEETVEILLVDGDPADEPRETLYLEAALDSEEDDSFGEIRGRFTPFAPERILPEQLSSIDWQRYAAVILANVGSFSREEVAALKRYADRGGAVIGFFGDQVSAEAYNALFREEERSLLPVVLAEVRGSAAAPVHLAATDVRHPVVQFFEEHRDQSYMHRPLASFSKYFAMDSLPAESPSFRVLFRFNDLAKTPAILDSAYGRGRVMWMNFSADGEWTTFPSFHDYVVLLYESIYYLLRFGVETVNLGVGEVFARIYAADEYASEVSLVMPESSGDLGDVSRVRTIQKAMRRQEDAGTFELLHEETSAPGIYSLQLGRPHSPMADGIEYFCVNVDTEEGDLRRLAEADLKQAFSSLEFRVLDVSERVRQVASEQTLLRGREFWKWAVSFVLVLLMAESILAWLFGRRAT